MPINFLMKFIPMKFACSASLFLLTMLLSSGRMAVTAAEWTQQAEVQPSVERGVSTAEAKPPVIPDAAFNDGPVPNWIWGPDNQQNYRLKTTFQANGVVAARLMASADNMGSISINGRQVASGSEWAEPMSADITDRLADGHNTITADVQNAGGVAALVLKLVLQHKDGRQTFVVSNTDWTVVTPDSESPAKVALRGTYGDGPWGPVFNNLAAAGRVPRGVFEVLPGFQVEKLFTVPKDELGSWVCIAFDEQGRLLASDQGNKGICRITLPPVGGEPAETKVERLDFSSCQFQPSGAQGILAAFGSVYFCCNGGPGSGLYRARDTDGDDQFDECVRLKSFRGGGEHGPHSLRLSPDGKRIFVIAGNHTDPPFRAGEEQDNENYSSRVPTNWDEDLLLPRMWDANGHARGKLAPGGWIASTDPDGKTWNIWSIGYRNPYDMAFNADGELFAYDADMEWDVGLPWYRPTRVVHATSGSEFGWRSGSGKWPDYYIDSLPPLVNIGPGSPVGVDFGYGPPRRADSKDVQNARASVPASRFGSKDEFVFTPLAFPAKYQKAMYICDWTFGTMYAIHTEPRFSSYTASKEEFVSRSPLPLTDVAAGADGALYFTIGGRGTQSELYRVTYVGDESVTPQVPGAAERSPFVRTRRVLEQLHDSDLDWFQFMQAFHKAEEAGPLAKPEEMGQDPFLMTAARRLIQQPKFATAVNDAISRTAPDADHLNQLVVAMTRAVGVTDLTAEMIREPAIKALMNRNFSDANPDEQLDQLRALSLVYLRLGEPSDSERTTALQKLDDHFPADDRHVNRELCQMLVYLQSPTVVAKTVQLMKQDPQRDDIDMGELLTRNAGYGRAIKAMLENQPDKNQVWYAYCLRVAKVGWTPERRADYFRWFKKALTWSGGNSYRKFLQNIENEAWQNTSFDHRVLVEAAGARSPFQVAELPKAEGPGQAWTIDQVRALAKNQLKNRDFANGQKMFAAARCVLCHRFAGDGGATGPDLTQLAGRFNIEALTEAIMDPSKVISDQYKASTVVTSAGRTINGRIVSENDHQISVLTDPEDSTKVVDIARNDIEEVLPSTVSIMPADLLKPLNEDEVLDLLAYLLSRGDEKHSMFK